MSGAGIGLETILAPIHPRDFLERYWQKKELVHTLGEPYPLRMLISLAQVDYLISSISSPDDGLIVKARSPVPPDRDWQTLELSFAYQAYESGDTILLTKLHRRWPPIGRLCESISLLLAQQGVALSKEVGANLYLTPKNSAAFPPHYDDHDVFIIQLGGKKHWRIYGSGEPFPIERQARMMSRDELPALRREIIIEPGDLLYIPRGAYHEAFTTDSYSMHLTISMFPCTWVDLISKLLERLPQFHEALPVVHICGDSELSRQYQQRVGELLRCNNPEMVADCLIEALADNSGGLTEGDRVPSRQRSSAFE